MKHYCHPVVTVGLVHLRVLQSWASPGTPNVYAPFFSWPAFLPLQVPFQSHQPHHNWVTGERHKEESVTFSWIQKHNSLLPTASWTLPTMSHIPNFNMLKPVFIPLLQTSPIHTSTTVTKATIRSLFLMMIYVFVLLLTQP